MQHDWFLVRTAAHGACRLPVPLYSAAYAAGVPLPPRFHDMWEWIAAGVPFDQYRVMQVQRRILHRLPDMEPRSVAGCAHARNNCVDAARSFDRFERTVTRTRSGK